MNQIKRQNVVIVLDPLIFEENDGAFIARSACVLLSAGEDRWLCTLLLQAGFKVEYCAASDAYTFAPEGFYEFYRQRRRWGPSTRASILDLLLSWKHTTRINDYISVAYVVYQTILFVFSLFGTGRSTMAVQL